MRSVSLKKLESRLGDYVRLAAGGETVLVTDGDRVVAQLVPPQTDCTGQLVDAVFAEAVRQGWVTPPSLTAGGPPPRKPVMAYRELVSDPHGTREDR
jgi:antitoxin (DNA-binding transcriptional repressor) of toxin-antitoxin stability system